MTLRAAARPHVVLVRQRCLPLTSLTPGLPRRASTGPKPRVAGVMSSWRCSTLFGSTWLRPRHTPRPCSSSAESCCSRCRACCFMSTHCCMHDSSMGLLGNWAPRGASSLGFIEQGCKQAVPLMCRVCTAHPCTWWCIRMPATMPACATRLL